LFLFLFLFKHFWINCWDFAS